MESNLACGIRTQVQGASPHAHIAGNLRDASLLARLEKKPFSPPFLLLPLKEAQPASPALY